MPQEMVNLIALPLWLNPELAMIDLIFSANINACSEFVFGNNMTNSSPPKRATKSVSLQFFKMSWATRAKVLSPAL